MSGASPAWYKPSRTAPMFAALGDENRLGIVARLCSQGPLSITRLAAGSSVTRQAVTKHLNVLATAGLVRGVRRGRERVWELEPQELEAAHRYLDQVAQRWDAALGRLKKFVEEGSVKPARRQ